MGPFLYLSIIIQSNMSLTILADSIPSCSIMDAPVSGLGFIKAETCYVITIAEGNIELITVSTNEDPIVEDNDQKCIAGAIREVQCKYPKDGDGYCVVSYKETDKITKQGDFLLEGEIDDFRRELARKLVEIFGIERVSWTPTKIAKNKYHSLQKKGVISFDSMCTYYGF